MALFVHFPCMLLNAITALAESSEGIGASSGKCGTNLTWKLEDGILTISGTGVMANYSSSSGAPWEARKSSITSVVVQEGVTSIGDCAFAGCGNLTSVSLPEGLRTLGESSFSSCEKLAAIALPTGVTTIGGNCFASCSSLNGIVLPETLTSIGYSAFVKCLSLASISLPNSVTSIGSYIFSDCTNLRSIQLSNSLNSIPERAFIWSENLEEITIPEGITVIGECAFNGASLKQIHFPGSLESVCSNAFRYCNALTDVYYPKGQAEVENISFGTGNTAVTGATWHFGEALHEWTKPVYTWGEGHTTLTAARTCIRHPDEAEEETVAVRAAVTAVPTEISEGAYSYVSDAFRNNAFACQTELIRVIPALSTLSMLDLPKSLNAIEAAAFEGLPCEAVIIPDGCVSIGSRAFADCGKLVYVRIPASVTSIADDAFAGSSQAVIDRAK